MKKSGLIGGLIAVAVTAGVIFGYAYVASKGWKAAQK